MIESRFGESTPFSLGVEEELMILDAETYEPVPAVRTIIAESEGLDLPGRLKTELHASVVELNTDVCGTAAEALEAVRALRAAAATLAERHGLRVAATGSHPFARPEELEIVTEPRYQELVEYAGITARRQGVSGLHVHVGMPDAETCMQALEGVLPWLPVVLALSANSPYLAGAEAGMLSARAEVLSLLPRRGAPPAFGGYADWERFVERLVASGLVRDYTAIWWDVRPHPRFGTLEIRMPDQPTSIALTGAFIALLQALCVAVVRDPRPPPDAAGRGIYDQNRWAAARFGPHGKLIHPDGDEAIPAGELADELLRLVGPAGRERGSERLLTGLDTSTCEADRQLQIGRRDGLEAVCADLVERSRPS